MRDDSRDINDLRHDVAANVRIFIDLMAKKGFPVGLSSTYRNDEQQAWLYAQGRTRDLDKPTITGSKVTTFHGARLAFDIYQNVKGKEYNDPAFWKAADELLAKMGFSRLTNEKCHAQWSEGGRYSGTQVRSGQLPNSMPIYGESFKDIIQSHVNFSDPDGVWAYMDKHPYADALYKKWAESYK